MLKGKKVTLRAVEPWDLDKLLEWENDQKNWRVSNTLVPFSKEIMSRYIENAQDIYALKQVRFVITEVTNLSAIGTIDLFDFEPKHQRAGVGILIDEEHRGRGYAYEALSLIEDYALNVVGIRNLYCNILEDNEESQRLFEKVGYVQVGRKINWHNALIDWLDELMYQKVLV
ncbi:MAG: GNAT family N-acetyltransferase [Crocinitomicaceae bacterium]